LRPSLALLLIGLSWPVVIAATKPFGANFTVTTVSDSVWGHCEMQIIVDAAATGSASVACRDDEGKQTVSKAPLSRQQVGELRVSLQQSDLFQGQYWGTDARGLDMALQTLTVMDGARTATLVVSFNDSFQGGPRKRLWDWLDILFKSARGTSR
jgi:hypothetical protein